MKKIILSGLILCSAVAAKSQYAIGADINYKVFFNGGALSTPALGISFINHLGDGDVMFYSGAAFGFPKTFKSTTLGQAYDETNPQQTIDVDISTKYLSFYFDLGVGKYFGGDYEDGGLVGFGGITSVLAIAKNTVGNYDRNAYHISGYDDETPQIGFAYGIKGGLGYLVRLGSMGLFPYADINIPVVKPSDTTIPVYMGIGVKLSFFKE